MTKLPDGLYDLLFTQAIEKEIAQLGSDRRADIEPLEPADSHLLLARHIAGIVRETLRGVAEEERAARQTEICNEVLRSVARSLPDRIEADDFVPAPPRRLAAIYPMDPLRPRRPSSSPTKASSRAP